MDKWHKEVEIKLKKVVIVAFVLSVIATVCRQHLWDRFGVDSKVEFQ